MSLSLAYTSLTLPTLLGFNNSTSVSTLLHRHLLLIHTTMISSIKTLAESPNLTSIPSIYTFTKNPDEPIISNQEVSVPIIDFSLLTSGTPAQRSKVVEELRKACQDWGFFMVIKHGVPESLMKAMIDACREFFDLTEKEKQEFGGKHVLNPIRYGTSFNASVDKVFFWRDYLKVIVHPQFHSLNNPTKFREISLDYCKRTRDVTRELLKGISESLGLEACYIEKALDLERGLQVLVANYYPPCPQPELAIGLPPHSDHGLLTLLAQNEVGGLQIQHKGKWVNVNAIPNSFLVNTADHLEILSNGKYKSVLHRAIVNNKSTRISLAMPNGPSMEAVVSPAPEMVNGESSPPEYMGMKYKEYLELQQGSQISGKSCLDHVRITTV